MAMEIFEVDEATDYEYDLAEWIESMMFSYQRMEAYEKCICFCKEVLETFAWKNSSPAMFKRCIGECLFTLGKTDESDHGMRSGSNLSGSLTRRSPRLSTGWKEKITGKRSRFWIVS